MTAPVVVVGAGIAGMTAALELRGSVLVSDTAPGTGGSTPWAQGGMAAAVGAGDSIVAHAQDTIGAGAGLVDGVVATLVTADGPDVVRWLATNGTRWDRRADGAVVVSREAAHGRDRIVHHRDATGAEIARALSDAVAASPDVAVLSGHRALDLLRDCGDGTIAGVLTERLDDGVLVAVLSPAVIVATGGYGHLWAATTNPEQVMGDGLAMAARAGVTLADLEFVQFHPTALAVDADPKPLLTEALRGAGAMLVDETGHRFCFDVHPDGELAPRDVVARAIYTSIAEGRGAWLDARAVADVAGRFPTVTGLALRHGFDPQIDLLPVTPVTHYCMGGIDTGLDGRTSLAGLWAIGEAASSGLHGANRLASNSLLEGVVMGRRVAADVRSTAEARVGTVALDTVVVAAEVARAAGTSGADSVIVEAVRELLWNYGGVARTGPGLLRGLAELQVLARSPGCGHQARNALLVAELVLRAAIARTESRGAHFRLDHPAADPAQASRQTITLAPAQTMCLDELAVAAPVELVSA